MMQLIQKSLGEWDYIYISSRKALGCVFIVPCRWSTNHAVRPDPPLYYWTGNVFIVTKITQNNVI